jgi:hypothetical protein
MKSIILYRGTDFEKEELPSASSFFQCTNRRPDIKQDHLVIGRYAMVPFYLEQAQDIEYIGAKLINNYHQHLYVADLGNYVADLAELTPATWANLEDMPDVPVILKGETNSRKSYGFRDMYASNKQEAIQLHNRLSNDSLISQQKIYIRQYVPLMKLMDGINGMPVTKEFRFFIAYGQILCGAFYWQNYQDDLPSIPSPSEVPQIFLQQVINRVDGQSNFYTIDVGQKQDGSWTVIELNEGQQSGLSCNDPYQLYKGLARTISELV